eukprot:CAMPEP_0115759046 /NCGR_PEP_ID=MMETSP0272-20121206/99272_1 /TAXON_ID=71861 /ORGANISM="Scrippsiella trochoidea, Strain CCMP3099" /LENGTH=218 /DNA_ID=CAMNT_0003204649 /DNA_START=46 /DNA_END=698 /DNA_ORIENTATION=+
MASTNTSRTGAGKLAALALGGAAAALAVLRHAAADRDEVEFAALRGAGFASSDGPSVQMGSSTYGVAGAALALGALGALTSFGSRDESVATMFTKHDKKTRRGKIHRGTFGKARMRPEARKKLHDIRLGKRQPGQDFNLVQVGQPEPEHTWDLESYLYNPMYYFTPQQVADAEIALEARNKHYRQDGEWQRRYGKFGSQWAFKNWTPPTVEEEGSAPP